MLRIKKRHFFVKKWRCLFKYLTNNYSFIFPDISSGATDVTDFTTLS
jgi:hypothetical protein